MTRALASVILFLINEFILFLSLNKYAKYQDPCLNIFRDILYTRFTELFMRYPHLGFKTIACMVLKL